MCRTLGFVSSALLRKHINLFRKYHFDLERRSAVETGISIVWLKELPLALSGGLRLHVAITRTLIVSESLLLLPFPSSPSVALILLAAVPSACRNVVVSLDLKN